MAVSSERTMYKKIKTSMYKKINTEDSSDIILSFMVIIPLIWKGIKVRNY